MTRLACPLRYAEEATQAQALPYHHDRPLQMQMKSLPDTTGNGVVPMTSAPSPCAERDLTLQMAASIVDIAESSFATNIPCTR